MGCKKTPGLYKRGGIWHVDKQVLGERIRESTKTSSLKEAERYLTRRIEVLRDGKLYGIRPPRSFREAGEKYIRENQHKRSIHQDVLQLKILTPYIGQLPLSELHMGILRSFIDIRKAEGVKNATINQSIQLVRRILNVAASEWFDDNGLTWLGAAPKIKLLSRDDAREPYPLSWEEQQRLFEKLPLHLRCMALFAVNTGCRSHEVCTLRWTWEREVPELNTSVFIIPKAEVKNGHDRLVILNDVSREVIESVRGQHLEYVFSYKGRGLMRMLNTGWKDARREANLPVRVHDLKHTFGRRLRAAGVGFEDRQDLLGHKSTRITTHYSKAELKSLLEAANKVCTMQDSAPTLALLTGNHPRIFPTGVKEADDGINVIC